MRNSVLRVIAGVCLLMKLSFASFHPDPAGRYERIICVVPLVGSGTVQDPKRPLFTLAADLSPNNAGIGSSSKNTLAEAGIAAFQSVPTDDGKAAIVMFVAHRYTAFKPILASPKLIQKFERKDIPEIELVNQLRKYKHDFTIGMLRVGAL